MLIHFYFVNVLFFLDMVCEVRAVFFLFWECAVSYIFILFFSYLSFYWYCNCYTIGAINDDDEGLQLTVLVSCNCSTTTEK